MSSWHSLGPGARELRVEGSGGLEIASPAQGLQQAGHWASGDRKSGLSDIVSYDCLFGKRKPSREHWCPSPPPEREIQLAHVLPSSPTRPWSACAHACTYTHTGTHPLIAHPTTPNPVHTGEVGSPHSKRHNRAPGPCAYISTQITLQGIRFSRVSWASHDLLKLSFPIFKMQKGKLLSPTT